MRTVKIAFALLLITLGAVIINSVILRQVFDTLAERAEAVAINDADAAYREYNEIFDDFKSKEWFISLTVNHEDLTSVEDGFSEIIGAAEANDVEGMSTIKSRLINSLEHLSRLAGINIESIF